MKVSTMRAVLGTSAAIGALALPATAAADAPLHTEVGDAGQTIATAQTIGGTVPLTTIQGTVSAYGDSDLYKICLGDAAVPPFSASVDGTFETPPDNGDESTFFASGASETILSDPMLTLIDTQSKVYDFADDNGVAGGAYLPNSTASVQNPPAGTYYLGISGYPFYPASANGDPATVPGSSFSEFKGNPAGASAGNIGSYTIKLTNVVPCPVAGGTAKVDGPLTPFLSDGSSRFKFGTTLEIRVKPRDASGNVVTGLTPRVNIVRTGGPSGPQTPNVAFNSTKGYAGTAARYSSQFGQYQFYASTKGSQFNAGKDLTPGRYRVDVTDPSFPGDAHKVSRNFSIVP